MIVHYSLDLAKYNFSHKNFKKFQSALPTYRRHQKIARDETLNSMGPSLVGESPVLLIHF